VDHLPAENLYQSKELDAADEDSSIHNLVLGLVGLEEFDATKNSQSQKDEKVCPEENYAGEHFSVVEVF